MIWKIVSFGLKDGPSYGTSPLGVADHLGGPNYSLWTKNYYQPNLAKGNTGPRDMVHIIWIISYGPYDMVQVQW